MKKIRVKVGTLRKMIKEESINLREASINFAGIKVPDSWVETGANQVYSDYSKATKKIKQSYLKDFYELIKKDDQRIILKYSDVNIIKSSIKDSATFFRMYDMLLNKKYKPVHNSVITHWNSDGTTMRIKFEIMNVSKDGNIIRLTMNNGRRHLLFIAGEGLFEQKSELPTNYKEYEKYLKA